MHRIHRAVSADGTEIAGRMFGEGPPLVLVHGAATDGDSEWGAAVPYLEKDFTCHVMSTRCRGLSGHSDDLSPARLVEDVTAFVDSIGAPVRLAGTSGGGMFALGAAAQSVSVAAVACWEAVVFEALPESAAASFQATFEQMVQQHEADQAADAVRTFLSFVGNDKEMTALAADHEFERAARYLSVDLREIEQASTPDGLSPTDPATLACITAPTLLLYGTESRQAEWFQAGAELAAHHIPDARVRPVAGTGHLACQVAPEPVARELLTFFNPRRDPASGRQRPRRGQR